MILTSPLQIVLTLLREWDALLEDRIDDLVRQYAQTMKWERQDIEKMARYDPSRNKKYLPWIMKQWAENQTLVYENFDAIHDMLMEFERLIAIPAFEGSRDIYAYDLRALQKKIHDNAGLRSQSEIERKAKEAKKTKEVSQYEHKEGVKSIGTLNDLELLQITNAESLAWWAWRGYTEENPNWGRPTIHPPPPGQEVDIRDGKWCVRKTTHGLNYLRQEPFLLVLKKGWPYIGILLKQGQVKNLDNNQVDMGVAEEIYPLLRPEIEKVKAAGKTLGYEATIFENMRFLSGEVQPGEKFQDDIDLRNSSLAALPPNLIFERSVNVENTKITEIPPGTVVNGSFHASGSSISKIGEGFVCGTLLDLSNTPIASLPEGLKVEDLLVANTPLTELPEGLKVKTLHIEGTQITELPKTLTVEHSMTWSEPMTLKECKMQFFRNNLEKLKAEAVAHPKLKGLSPAAFKKKWPTLERNLIQYYLTDPAIDGHVKSMFIYKKPITARETH